MNIPYNRPFVTDNALGHIKSVFQNRHLAGNGPYTQRCQQWLENKTGCRKSILVHSGTAALEVAAMLIGIEPGDEIIMPSYTFVTTANSFVLRGGVPVFIDIRKDTLNLDETLIEQAITPKTKAIVPVHYAGIGCEMDKIMDIARKHNLFVIEDAAHGMTSAYRGQPLGSIGHLGILSFHETKNIISGEGGALLINDERFLERAPVLCEKGTNRSQFLAKLVDKYTWVDIGSSYMPSELIAAFLYSQFEETGNLQRRRLRLWNRYHELLAPLEAEGLLRRPIVPPHCRGNAHIYYALLPTPEQATQLRDSMAAQGIQLVAHFQPLHASKMGQAVGRVSGPMEITNSISDRIVRFPLWQELTPNMLDVIIAHVGQCLKENHPRCKA